MPRIAKVAALTALLLLIWSALLAPTFRFPFFWDDFHLIRHYSTAETLSAFHAVIDPDKIETPGLRPCSIFLYNFQGSVFGENIVAQHAFMVVLMGIFMTVVGSLLLELGLSFPQLVVVFILFVASRIFASLALWISLSHLILAYLWIALTAYLFVLWAKRGRWLFFVAMIITATLATFTREETYTLPLVLPLLWLICFFDPARSRRVMVGALSLLVIVCFHYWLWHFLVPNALSPKLNFGTIKKFFISIAASCLPGGYQMIGATEMLFGVLWIVVVIAVVSIFVAIARSRVRWQFFGVCCVGVLLCLPALAIARPFGIALPTLAFLAAIAIADGEIYTQLQIRTDFRQWKRAAIIGLMAIGLAAGIVGGVRRSYYVAESLQQNCALRAERDGEFLFNLFTQPVTIPEARRQAGLARLNALGIKSRQDAKRLQADLAPLTRAQWESLTANEPYEPGQHEWPFLFESKYEYLSF